tara:strand:- start:3471 stop:3905 length:435 start_codon:yes stop_codon:yes gene_type:complete
MSTSIFTFDHSQRKLHNAIGVKEEYIDDLSSKLNDIVVSLKCNEDTVTVNDVSPSQVVEHLLHELSYSQLVLLSSFYIIDKIDEIEKRTLDDVESHVFSSDDVPDEIKDILRNMKGKSVTSAEDLPEPQMNKLLEFLKTLRNRK